MSRGIWATLGIPANSDRDTIRRAYAAKLRVTNPEDDPEGFMALRAAYEAALQRAGRVVEPIADAPEREDDENAAAPHVTPAAPDTLHVEHAEPEPPDPELADLQARWDALATSLETRWGADPALLRALLAAPALERITVRAEIEGHVAALIAEHIPKSDTLVVPAIRAFGWAEIGTSARANPAVRAVLAHAAELPQNGGGDEAAEPVPQGIFNRLSRWSGGVRFWIFAALLIFNILRFAGFEWGPGAGRDRLPDAVPSIDADGGSVPFSGRAPVMVPLKAAPPDAGRWLTPRDVVFDRGVDALTVKVFVHLDVTLAGLVSGCSVDDAQPASRMSEATCDLLVKRARLAPTLDGNGKAVARSLLMTAMWARQLRGGYAPVAVTPPPEAESTRRAPECVREPIRTPGVEHPPSPCSPQANWLTDADFPTAKLLAAGSRTLTARFEVGRDGYISNCRLDPPSGVAAVDATVCRLLIRRGHYLPGRDSSGRTTRWNNGFAWGWTVSKREAPLPVPAVPKAEFKASATDAPLGGDDLPM